MSRMRGLVMQLGLSRFGEDGRATYLGLLWGLGEFFGSSWGWGPIPGGVAHSPLVSQSWKEAAPSCLVVRLPPHGKHRVRPASGW